MRHWFKFILLTVTLLLFQQHHVQAHTVSEKEMMEERMHYYIKFSNELVPWYYLAAIDQYERNVQQVRNDIVKLEGPVRIHFSTPFWAGLFNPFQEDQSPVSIAFFNGFGEDGNGDGIADQTTPEDMLQTLTSFLSQFDMNEKGFQEALTIFYEKEETVRQVLTIAKLYEHFETIALDAHHFPIPTQYHYSYRGTWGASRGWGGRRIHEGTDIFASYGVPVLATSYGIVEIIGWNEYGGWRVGIRDHRNNYHYFAHLSSFHQDIKEGTIVEPGTIIGYVGSSGYGKEGTSGKFPPHLHYGIYKYNGRIEWSFDPYPHLRKWEQQK